MIPLLVTLGIIVLIAFFMINVYNRLAKARVLTQEGWSGIGTFLSNAMTPYPTW